jgi:hypothetical protein
MISGFLVIIGVLNVNNYALFKKANKASNPLKHNN